MTFLFNNISKYTIYSFQILQKKEYWKGIKDNIYIKNFRGKKRK